MTVRRPTLRARLLPAVAALATAFAVTACSGSSDDAAPRVSGPAVSVVETVPVDDPADFGFDGLAGTPNDTMPPGDFDLSIGPQTIIATDDGKVPEAEDPDPGPHPDDLAPGGDPRDDVTPLALPDPATVGRIVSLSPTHTETLYALGLGEYVVAVDPQSDFPAEVVAKQQSGLNEQMVGVDPLLALDPDVVVLGEDPTGLAGRLADAGVAAYVGAEPSDLDGALAQMVAIASIVGQPERGEALVADLRAQIADLAASMGPADANGARGSVFHELDPSLFTIGDDTVWASAYAALGLDNLGPATGIEQVAQDALVAADPDVIVLADAECCDVSVERLVARPGWTSLDAVASGSVVVAPDALVTRWGPRIVELLRLVATAATS